MSAMFSVSQKVELKPRNGWQGNIVCRSCFSPFLFLHLTSNLYSFSWNLLEEFAEPPASRINRPQPYYPARFRFNVLPHWPIAWSTVGPWPWVLVSLCIGHVSIVREVVGGSLHFPASLICIFSVVSSTSSLSVELSLSSSLIFPTFDLPHQ